jgi:pimeloyl-ACP methyl ester carboxylesterase
MQTFTASDDVKISYQIFGERSEDPPVVLHHGFGASSEINWVVPGIVSALIAAGRWVLSVDARGHGRSQKPRDPALYGEAIMARDVVDLMNRLQVLSYDLVGYSMGAVVSLLVAVADSRVRRLILGGVGAGAVEQGGVDRRVLAPTDLIAALETDDPSVIEEPLAQSFRNLVDATGADRFALAAQARAVHVTPIRFDRIHVPTLVIAGDGDPLAAFPETLVRAIPRARLEQVRGDHMTALFEPRFRESVVSFLA